MPKKKRSRRRKKLALYEQDGYTAEIVESYPTLLEQMNKCRAEGHSKYSHDIFGKEIRFRSIVCRDCKKKFVYIEEQ